MQNYPTLKTAVPYLQLQPLQEKHLPFIVELLSQKEIQKTLFRVPTKISLEKERNSIARMYESEKSKEITYILTIKKLFTEKFIGYVKLKIIDWSEKSGYLSVAILPTPEYRGKGYAKATYDSFFDFLFSLGFMKIYGRTNEANTATIKLNNATGFKLIGRQSDFFLYPNDTSLDGLLFEKLNPLLHTKFEKPYDSQLRLLQDQLLPLIKARQSGNVTVELLSSTIQLLKEFDITELPKPFKLLVQEITRDLTEENASDLKTTVINQNMSVISEIRRFRADNASAVGYGILAYPITQQHVDTEYQIVNSIIALLTSDTEESIDASFREESLTCGVYTQENWEYLSQLFLGRVPKNSTISIITRIKQIKTNKTIPPNA